MSFPRTPPGIWNWVPLAFIQRHAQLGASSGAAPNLKPVANITCEPAAIITAAMVNAFKELVQTCEDECKLRAFALLITQLGDLEDSTGSKCSLSNQPLHLAAFNGLEQVTGSLCSDTPKLAPGVWEAVPGGIYADSYDWWATGDCASVKDFSGDEWVESDSTAWQATGTHASNGVAGAFEPSAKGVGVGCLPGVYNKINYAFSNAMSGEQVVGQHASRYFTDNKFAAFVSADDDDENHDDTILSDIPASAKDQSESDAPHKVEALDTIEGESASHNDANAVIQSIDTSCKVVSDTIDQVSSMPSANTTAQMLQLDSSSSKQVVAPNHCDLFDSLAEPPGSNPAFFDVSASAAGIASFGFSPDGGQAFVPVTGPATVPGSDTRGLFSQQATATVPGLCCSESNESPADETIQNDMNHAPLHVEASVTIDNDKSFLEASQTSSAVNLNHNNSEENIINVGGTAREQGEGYNPPSSSPRGGGDPNSSRLVPLVLPGRPLPDSSSDSVSDPSDSGSDPDDPGSGPSDGEGQVGAKLSPESGEHPAVDAQCFICSENELCAQCKGICAYCRRCEIETFDVKCKSCDKKLSRTQREMIDEIRAEDQLPSAFSKRFHANRTSA